MALAFSSVGEDAASDGFGELLAVARIEEAAALGGIAEEAELDEGAGLSIGPEDFEAAVFDASVGRFGVVNEVGLEEASEIEGASAVVKGLDSLGAGVSSAVEVDGDEDCGAGGVGDGAAGAEGDELVAPTGHPYGHAVALEILFDAECDVEGEVLFVVAPFVATSVVASVAGVEDDAGEAGCISGGGYREDDESDDCEARQCHFDGKWGFGVSGHGALGGMGLLREGGAGDVRKQKRQFL